jgi:hypothetical protein
VNSLQSAEMSMPVLMVYPKGHIHAAVGLLARVATYQKISACIRQPFSLFVS